MEKSISLEVRKFGVKKRLAVLVAGSAIIFCGELGFAQSICFAQSMSLASRQAYCTRLARLYRRFNAFRFEQCMHPKPASATAPATQSPSAAPPPQPSAGGGKPLSPRATECNTAIADEGLTGTAAQNYLQRCLSAQ
jgi:hypothetical protein